MPAYPLDQVLAAFLCALTEAQHFADQYSATLQQESDQVSLQRAPRAELGRAGIDLKLAIAGVRSHQGEGDAPAGLPSVIEVLVDAADLRELPSWMVSTLHLELRVEDVEVLELPPDE